MFQYSVGVYYCVVDCSLGFFAPRHREAVNEAKFVRRGSVGSSLNNTDSEVDEDSKSIASMHELYTPKSRPEVRTSDNEYLLHPAAYVLLSFAYL